MRINIVIFSILFFCGFSDAVFADGTENIDMPASSLEVAAKEENSIKMLHSIMELKRNLNQRIDERKKNLETSTSETEKEYLNSELSKLDKQLNDAANDFERIATGIDLALFAEKKESAFNWKDELVSLVEPGIKEIKRMTVKVRYKTKLKDELIYYENLIPIAQDAIQNISALSLKTDDEELQKNLKNLLPEWKSIERQIQNKVEITGMQLTELENEEKSLIETSRISIKNFIRTRGLFLFTAVFSCICVVVCLRFLSHFLIKKIPGYASKYRPFHIRLFDLFSNIFVLFMALFVLILVFYIFEDWVLLSLAIIFIMGLGWTAKNGLPRFWQQSRLMLNIGAVREGERMIYNGIPWLVKNINVFCVLENPFMDVTLRLPIGELFGKASRPFNKNEPWFPCKREDWVILSDGTRGHITSMSPEMIQLVQRGGGKKTYQTADFLALSPLNLSTNFRLKIPFGLSYGIQKEITGSVLEIIEAYILDNITKGGYKKSLLDLRVEFEEAGSSSLDIVVITDFKGDLAHQYERLSRLIQKWCVDACTINNWEIPFPQLTIHQ